MYTHYVLVVAPSAALDRLKAFAIVQFFYENASGHGDLIDGSKTWQQERADIANNAPGLLEQFDAQLQNFDSSRTCATGDYNYSNATYNSSLLTVFEAWREELEALGGYWWKLDITGVNPETDGTNHPDLYVATDVQVEPATILDEFETWTPSP